ncbi:MAG: extensin family protein [Devosia sp.]|nr:extensin family protein [Devosia sp.]
MRISIALPIALFALLSLPAVGQDIFAPLRDMVEGITQKPEQAPRRPRPVVTDEAPPIPQKRPADLGGPETPVVIEPVKPLAPEVTRPVPPSPPVVSQPGVSLPRERPEEPVEAPKPEQAETPKPIEEAVPPAAEDLPAQPATEAAPKPAAEAEPARIFQTACPAMLTGQVEAKALPPISDGQCKSQSPLSVTGVLVNGRMVPFNIEAVTDCGMATALPEWIAEVDNYVKAHDDTSIASVTVGTGYMCRNVNNAAEGNLSFHAFADALDVVGFRLEDGRNVTVEEGWTGTEEQGSRIVKFAHDAACGHFTTTLGPEANALHHDHIHVDLGCHGKTCTSRLCE